MKYMFTTPELDTQIAGILSKIRLSMNGIVSEQMMQRGILYKKNYGVSIPRIKKIASEFIHNHDLAQRLWRMEIRETMILATLLEPSDNFTSNMANAWVNQFDQIEIVEQACQNLFCKLPYSPSLCKEFIQSETEWIQVTGFILAARVFEKLNQTEINDIIMEGMKVSVTTNFHIYKSVALCFSRFCRINKETATILSKEIKVLPHALSPGQAYIKNEVEQEILFMDIL